VALLLPIASSTSVAPYAAVIGFGFLIGAYGHVIHSRALIITGIVIVGGVSSYFAFVVGRVV
jgi:hypothetical protein